MTAEARRNHNEAVIHVRLQRIHAREGNIWELELKTAERINILQMGRAGSFAGQGSKNRLQRADWDDVSVPVTVGRCSENSKGENARSGKNSIERGRAERGRAERGRAERGRAERGRAERGRAERGQAERGQAERGQAERGQAERGQAERGQAE